MNLSFDDIKRITFGAINVTEGDDGIHFARCTEKQIKAWYSVSEFLGNGSKATTGIKLDFMTDSTYFEFSAVKGNRFELCIDGLLRQCYFMDELRESVKPARFEICDPLGKPYVKGEMHRVTLYFPCHGTGGSLGHVALEDGARIEPHRHAMKMLFIGDSITQGWDSGYDSMSYAPRVAEFFNADSVNQGIGGSVFNENAFDSLDFDPDVTIVACGTNDWSLKSSADDVYAHATAHLSLIREAFGGEGKRLFAISPIWRDSPKPSAVGSFSDGRATVIRAINEQGFIHIDGLSLVPPIPELYADKYLHPNALGFSFYSENLIKQIQRYL